jgi:predicted ATPase
MLTRLRLQNFRSHDDTVMDLSPINVLIGPVASGKSNIFGSLVLLQNSVHRSLVELFPPGLGEFHWVRSRWAQETDPIGIEVDVSGISRDPEETARYILKMAAGPEGLYVLEETLARRHPDRPDQWVFRRSMRRSGLGEFGEVAAYDPTVLNLVRNRDARVDPQAPGPRFAAAVARAISRFGYYHLEVSALKSLGLGQAANRIGYRGQQLPDFIAGIRFGEDRAVYDRILGEIQEILPDLESLIVTQVEAEQQGLAMSFRGHRGYITARDLSDGTLFTLGLLCIIHGPQHPNLLCIEEPETGLHPRRLRWLFERLLRLAYPPVGEDPTQVVISTHSPYLVDFLGELRDCVHVAERRDGRSCLRRLVDIQAQLHEVPDADEGIGHQWATGLYEGL